ncbi:MAG: YicC family protein [Phycisphaeraceae bacterium]|nr:YicC family protein [Phycisphaeraceae bacterium]
MTGFGEASAQIGGIHYAVELRSLNNKYFKATIRLPEEIGALEAELESALRKQFGRGSIVLTVRTHPSFATASHRINEAAIVTYLEHLETVKSKTSDQTVHIDITALLSLPGVLEPAVDVQTQLSAAREATTKLLDEAAGRLVAMRLTEGAVIAEDLERQSSRIRQCLETIRQRAPRVVEEYELRLKTRIEELLVKAELKVEQQDLLREVGVFAEKSDISEEVTRLAAHLDQAAQIVAAPDGDPAGRTLDFLAQELLREANTIASKSNDAEISRAIVEVKGAIDRIKEQVQNIE